MPNPLEERDRRLSELEKKVENLLRLGQVAIVHEAEALVDVRFDNDLLIESIPFLTMRAGEDQTYWLPSVGELGFLLAPSGDMANSVFLPGLFYSGFPAGEQSIEKHKTIYRDEMVEEVDVGSHSKKFTTGDSERFINQEEIKDTQGESYIKQNQSETEVKRATGAIKQVVGSNQVELSVILANILGAHLFASGVTTLQSPVGPVMFAPAASPVSAPSPPAESNPNSDGEATQTPPSTVSGVKVKTVSNLSFTIPSLVATTPSGPGSTVATPVNLAVTGTLTLEFPVRSL